MTMELQDIPEPVGSLIIDHPKLKWWKYKGYAQQKDDGLWLHYVAICELLDDVRAKTVPSASQDITESSGKTELFRKLSADTSST